MSGHVAPALISAIAESVGIEHLAPEAAGVLAPDVEYRLRDLLQEALKFARHGRRARMAAPDINHALQLRDFDQMHGFNATDRRRYATVAGATDVLYVEETLHRCEDLLYEPLPPPPVEVGITTHWFLVRGVKPRTPENAVPRALLEQLRQQAQARAAVSATPEDTTVNVTAQQTSLSAATLTAAEPAVRQPSTTPDTTRGPAPAAAGPTALAAVGGNGEAAALLPVVKHVVSEEQLELMRILGEVLLAPGAAIALDSPIFRTLARDAGLEQVVPYVVGLIASEVRACTGSLHKLRRLLQVAALLVQNRCNNLGAYLSQLVPAVMTCLMCGRLGTPRSNHWAIRDQAARCLALLLQRFSQPQLGLLARVSGLCSKALADTRQPLSTHYGAVQGLAAMGTRAVRLLLLQHIVDYYGRLVPILSQTSKLTKRVEAMHCLWALQSAVCSSCHDMVARISASDIDAAAWHRLSVLLDEPASARRDRLQERQHMRQQQESAIDLRMKEIEAASQQALAKQDTQRREQHALVQRRQDVEALAKASVNGTALDRGTDSVSVQLDAGPQQHRETSGSAAAAHPSSANPNQPLEVPGQAPATAAARLPTFLPPPAPRQPAINPSPSSKLTRHLDAAEPATHSSIACESDVIVIGDRATNNIAPNNNEFANPATNRPAQSNTAAHPQSGHVIASADGDTSAGATLPLHSDLALQRSTNGTSRDGRQLHYLNSLAQHNVAADSPFDPALNGIPNGIQTGHDGEATLCDRHSHQSPELPPGGSPPASSGPDPAPDGAQVAVGRDGTAGTSITAAHAAGRAQLEDERGAGHATAGAAEPASQRHDRQAADSSVNGLSTGPNVDRRNGGTVDAAMHTNAELRELTRAAHASPSRNAAGNAADLRQDVAQHTAVIPARVLSRDAEWQADEQAVQLMEIVGRDETRVGEHLAAVYEIFGEALLPWLPLGELSHALL